MPDLVDVTQVKSWLGIKPENTDDDTMIQFLISSFSDYVVWKTGRDSFSQVDHYIETYDGNGATRMFLRNTPIVTITKIQAGANTLVQSTSITSLGWYIEQSKQSIAFRTAASCAPTPLNHYRFPAGQGNILIDYTAGYEVLPPNLSEAVMRVVAQNYRRKDWIDIASKALAAGSGMTGTTRYQNWALEPYVVQILDFYSRYARP